MEKNMKLIQARDSILAFMLAKDFTLEEIRQALQMCNTEVDAWEKRATMVELNKDGEE